VSDAIQGSEAVILATPYDATSALLRGNATALAGKVVIDATNPLKPDLSGLSLTADVSGAELLQREAPSALLFKAFNTTGYGNMQNPDYPQGRAVMFVAGPDGKGPHFPYLQFVVARGHVPAPQPATTETPPMPIRNPARQGNSLTSQ
jgi:predicted dinucleotide-binding enzyme